MKKSNPIKSRNAKSMTAHRPFGMNRPILGQPCRGKKGQLTSRVRPTLKVPLKTRLAARKRLMVGVDLGQVPIIACVNQATVPLGVDFERLVAALHKFNAECYAPVWGTHANLVVAKKLIPGAWGMVFVDNPDIAGTMGYHDLTPDGHPLAKVFVKTILGQNEKVSVTACHELCEMLVDPWTNLCASGPDSDMIYAYETADAVEEQEFLLDKIAMCNFVYPAWFEGYHKPRSTQFDYLGSITRPFQLLKGGYMPVLVKGKWTQIYGSPQKAKRFAKEDRRGRRVAARRAHASGKPAKASHI